MRRDGDDRWLLAGRVVTGVASLMHVAIIVGGPELVPLFGAGERMARQAGSAPLTQPSLLPASPWSSRRQNQKPLPSWRPCMFFAVRTSALPTDHRKERKER